ncbi:MAG: M48 family metalloprotease [Candidatus Omnitrophica bacterium]|nr:M48 family metalloprotease [Candidatus Omnitrophota bacterium]
MKFFLPVCLACFCCAGCSGISTNFNTATDQQETTTYSTDREVQIGASVAQEVEKEFKVVDDVATNERVDRITQKIAAVCDRKEITYIGKVIEPKKPTGEKMVNAMSLPGGYVYVFKDLLEYIKDDHELAAVIAHEVGHVTARHSIKHLQASYGSFVSILAAFANPQLAGGMFMAFETMMLQYSQEDELEADALGFKYMKAAGYDTQGMVRMLEALQAYDRKQPIRQKAYGRTHPYIHQRIANVDKLIHQGDISYRDWVKMTGEEQHP